MQPSANGCRTKRQGRIGDGANRQMHYTKRQVHKICRLVHSVVLRANRNACLANMLCRHEAQQTVADQNVHKKAVCWVYRCSYPGWLTFISFYTTEAEWLCSRPQQQQLSGSMIWPHNHLISSPTLLLQSYHLTTKLPLKSKSKLKSSYYHLL